MGTRDVADQRPLDVLVVDDEPLIRWILRRGLTARGHRVSEASDGGGAIQALKAGPGAFDLVVLDYQLPDAHDFSLLADILRTAPGSPVLMMSACADGDMQAVARTMGASGMVSKPFAMDEMIRAIESVARTGQVSSSAALRV